METNEYHACKLTCANALESMSISLAQMTKLADRVDQSSALPGHQAVRCMINAKHQMERALLCFMDFEDHNIKQSR